MVVPLEEIQTFKDLRRFDHHVTAALSGYKNGAEYYAINRPLDRLKKLRETHSDKIGIFAAEDDPLIHPNALNELKTLAKDYYHVWLSKNGGHVGFVEGALPKRCNQSVIADIVSWIDK